MHSPDVSHSLRPVPFSPLPPLLCDTHIRRHTHVRTNIHAGTHAPHAHTHTRICSFISFFRSFFVSLSLLVLFFYLMVFRLLFCLFPGPNISQRVLLLSRFIRSLFVWFAHYYHYSGCSTHPVDHDKKLIFLSTLHQTLRQGWFSQLSLL